MRDTGFLLYLKYACWGIGILTVFGLILLPLFPHSNETLKQYMAKPVTNGDLWFALWVVILLMPRGK